MLDIDPRLQKLTKNELLELVVMMDDAIKFTDVQIAIAKCGSALRNGRLMMESAAAEIERLENKKGKAARQKSYKAYSAFKRGQKMYDRGQQIWQKIKLKQVFG